MEKKTIITSSFILFFLVVLSLFSYAASMSDTLTYSATPFYTTILNANSNGTYVLDIPLINADSRISDAIINVKGYISPTANIQLWVNGRQCRNPSVLISTSFANAGDFEIQYDCSNIITTPGTYTLTLRSDKAINSLYINSVITAYHKKPEFFVAGTDYQVGDNAKIFTTLTTDGVAINNASCIVEAFYPNGTVFIPYAPLTWLDNGIYYYDFIAPNTTGIYPMYILCTYRTRTFFNNASTFVRVLGGGGGGITNSYLIDGNTVNLDESAGSNRGIDAVFNFTLNSSLYNANTSFFSINADTFMRRLIGAGDPTDPIIISFYNYNTSRYDSLPGQFSYNTAYNTYIYSITTNVSNYIFNNTQVSIKVNDTTRSPTDTRDTSLEIDYLNVRVVSYISNETVITIAGGGELNVRDYVRDLNRSIYNATTDLTGVYSNLSFIQNQLNTLLSTNISIDYGLIWSYPVRNLTYYPAGGGGVGDFDFNTISYNVTSSSFSLLVNSTRLANTTTCLSLNGTLLSCDNNSTYAFVFTQEYLNLSPGATYDLNITLCNQEYYCIQKYYNQITIPGNNITYTGEYRYMALITTTTFTLSFETIAIILLCLAFIVGVFARPPGVKILCGIFMFLLSFVLMGTVGFPFALIIMGLGGIIGALGYTQLT